MPQHVKNKEEILLATDQVRGERIEEKDKSLFFFEDRTSVIYGKNNQDTIEFIVMDTENNLLHWEDQGLSNYSLIKGQAAVDSIILKPGNDLRRNGFNRGQFRISYNFFNNALGSFSENKVFIETISATRKEIRILPVITGDNEKDLEFAEQFEDFTDRLILGQDFTKLTMKVITDFPGFEEFITNFKELEDEVKRAQNALLAIDASRRDRSETELARIRAAQKSLENLKEEISTKEREFRILYGQLINAFEIHHNLQINTPTIPTILTQASRDIIITGVIKEAVKTVIAARYDSSAPPEGYVEYFEDRLFEIVSPSDELISEEQKDGELNGSFRFLKYVINFGDNKNFLIVNWVIDDIEFPEAPFSIIVKLLDPLPEEFEKNDQLWISRELTPPVFEKVFLQGVEEPEDFGFHLRPPNFNIEVDNMGRRSTPFESFDTLVSTHATTSQQLVDHFFSGSLEGVDINIDYTDYSNFVHFGSAEQRIENFKVKLGSIEFLDSQIVSLQNSSRSLNVLADIQRLETKKTNFVGDFDRYEQFLFTESGSEYSASIPESQSAPFNLIGEWPKQNRIEPFVLFSITSSQAEDWFDTQKEIAHTFDQENFDRLLNNTPSHILDNEENDEYVLFLNMIGQYFDVFHSYITALGQLHNRDENLFEGLSKDLTFNVVKSFGFDLENGQDFRPLWEHAFGFDISGSLNQSGDIMSGWENISGVESFETFITSSITPLDITSAINTVSGGNFRSNTTVNLPKGTEFTVLFNISGTLDGLNFFKISNNIGLNTAVFNQSLITGSNEFTITPTANWSNFFAGVRTTGTSSDFSLTNFTFRPTEGLIQSRPTTDVTKEIWRRILNNLPYLLKTKGTARSIKALLSCYGIPQTILAIREYGGPDPTQFPRLQDKSSFIFEDFVHSIDFDSAQDVTTPWKDFGSFSEKPHTVELTFKTTNSGIATQSLINVSGSSDGWGVSLRKTGSLFGKTQGMIVFEISGSEISSSVFDFYNDDFYTIILSHTDFTHSLFVKKAESSRISYQSSASVTSSGTHWEVDSTIQLGSGSAFGSHFSGSIKEFRLFQSDLSESVFDNHVRWPRSYNSNNPTSSFDDLVLRYSFDEPKNHNLDSIVQDTKINQAFTTIGTASGFENGVNYTPTCIEFAAFATQLGGNRFISNKIRIEDNTLAFGNLNTTQRMEVGSFDFAPLDSNRLGIYFSPTDTINRDIMATFGSHDISGVLGSPADVFNQEYKGLKELNDFYFQKFTTFLDYNKFIRFLKRYDLSLFQQLKRLLPARVDATVGILVEPHILERHKESVMRAIKSPDLLEKSASLDVVIFENTAEISEFNDVDIDTTGSFKISSNRSDLEMVIKTTSGDPSNYTAGNFWQQQAIIAVIPPREEVDSTFAAKKRDVSASDRLKYKGILNTKETSIDGKEPIETFFTNPNRIVSSDEGPSKLKVE